MKTAIRFQHKGFDVEVRRSPRYADLFSGFAGNGETTLNYVGAATAAEARQGIREAVNRHVRGTRCWSVMWYEQGAADESVKRGFRTREDAEAWARQQPAVRRRYSHAMVFSTGISHPLRRRA